MGVYDLTKSNSISLPTDYQSFIHVSRYARWIEEENRRETWEETVNRYFNYLEKHTKENNNFSLSVEKRKELLLDLLNQ